MQVQPEVMWACICQDGAGVVQKPRCQESCVKMDPKQTWKQKADFIHNPSKNDYEQPTNFHETLQHDISPSEEHVPLETTRQMQLVSLRDPRCYGPRGGPMR